MADSSRSGDAPMISVALPVFNGARTLALAIASVRAQTEARWELIVVDDGSNDGSDRIVAAIADARIRVFADGRRRGLSARLNQAVSLARGEFVARMDQDDVSYPERFARQAAYLHAHPDVSLVASSALVFEGEGRAVGLLGVRERHAEIVARPWAGFHFPHPTWMGRAAWFRAHPYNERNALSQDQELLLQTHVSSRFAALPEPLLGYRQDSIGLRKVLHSRVSYSRALARQAASRGAPLLALRGIGGQVAKGAFDTLVISSGMGRRLLSHRARVLSPGAEAHWRDVWRSVSERAAQA